MNTRPFNRYVVALLLCCIACFYLYNGIQYIEAQSITSDEASFYNYAVRFLKGNPERVTPVTDNSKMPVAVLNTLPRLAEQLLSPGLQKNDMGVSDMLKGRWVTLIFSLCTLALVFLWAKQLFDVRAGLFSAFLFACCPNNMAAATLVTTDSYSVFFLLLSMYFTWLFCNTRNFSAFLALSFTVALSQLVKQSLFHLYILVPLCILLFGFVKKETPIKGKGVANWKLLLVFIGINLMVINCGYYFYGTNTPIGSYNFMSGLFKTVQNLLPSWLPLPFPKPFVEGLDMAKYYDQVGGGIDGVSSFGKVTILNRSFTGSGIWYYYFVSILFKTPLAYFLFFGIAFFFFVRNKQWLTKTNLFIFLLLPVLYFLLLMSFLYQTQCGVRHIIFIYPLLFIFSSSIVFACTKRLLKAVVLAGLVYLPVSMFVYYRNYYSYTNELIVNKVDACKYVGAANLDFMHTGIFFHKYLEANPNVKWVEKKPSPGIYLITVEDYLDIWNRHAFDWVTKYKPIGHVAHAGLLIKVTASDLQGEKN